jgi:CRISPR-associated endonuclease/helicase Cas3
VPIYRLQAWLRNSSVEADLGADVPIRSVSIKQETNSHPMQRCNALRWRGVENSEPVTSIDELIPGDLVVLSGKSGEGRDDLGDFPPASLIDVGDAMQIIGRSWPVLRLTSAVMSTWYKSKATTELAQLILMKTSDELAASIGEIEFVDELRSSLMCVVKEQHDDKPSWLHDSASWLAKEIASRARSRRVLHLHPEGGIILRSVRRMPQNNTATDDFAGEDNTGSATVAVSLKNHSLGVARRAQANASACGLSKSVQKSVELAGWFHDIGKSDPRFQGLLRGGTRSGEELLAKSSALPLSKVAQNEVATRTCYPLHGRHELLSVRLAEPLITALPPESRDLILHLIAATHGHCRPFAPIITDEAPEIVGLRWPSEPQGSVIEANEVRHSSKTGLEHLGSDVTGRFWRMTRSHGWWGLALLETIVLLADHRTSEAEQRDYEKEIQS